MAAQRDGLELEWWKNLDFSVQDTNREIYREEKKNQCCWTNLEGKKRKEFSFIGMCMKYFWIIRLIKSVSPTNLLQGILSKTKKTGIMHNISGPHYFLCACAKLL